MRKPFAIALLLSTSNLINAQSQQLWPTAIAGSDCVASQLVAKKSEFARNEDRQYCEQHNSGQAEALQTCLDNSADDQQVVFFSDRCSSETYYLSINGKQYQLKRKPSGKIEVDPHIGSFVGADVQMTVRFVKHITRELIDGDTPSGSAAVAVELKIGRRVERFKATLLYGP
jgi:hypothetical protein